MKVDVINGNLMSPSQVDSSIGLVVTQEGTVYCMHWRMHTIKPLPRWCIVPHSSRSLCTASTPGKCGVGSTWPRFASWISATSILLRAKTSASSWNSDFQNLTFSLKGIGCCRRCVPGSAGMASPGVLPAQSFTSIACTSCERRTCSPEGQGFFGVWSTLWSILGISGCYVIGFVVTAVE